MEDQNVIDHGWPIFDLMRVRTMYPRFQKISFFFSIGSHVPLTVCLSGSKTPFTYFAHKQVQLVVILLFVWVACLLLIRLAKLLEEETWFDRSVKGSFVHLFIDGLVTIGLAVGSTFISCKLAGPRHLARILRLLADITLIELCMLEDKDFCIGDSIFNLASCTAFLKFEDRWHDVGVIIIFVVRKFLLFGLKQKIRKKGIRDLNDRNRTMSQREVIIRLDARDEAARKQRAVTHRMREEHATEIADLVTGLLQDHEAEFAALRQEHEAAITDLRQEHAAAITALQQGHATEVNALRQRRAS